MFTRLCSLFNRRSRICLSTSIASWVMANDERFNVPTFSKVQETLSKHESSNNNNMSVLNQQFFSDTYDKLIAKFDKRFSNNKRREVLNFIPNIIEEIAGKDGLKNKCVIEIGPGTGVYIPEFANAVGDNGCYIGLDISPAFVHFLDNNERFKRNNNVRFNLNSQESLCLPQELKGKVDLFFLAATYHHVEKVEETLNQIYDYLKPGGKLIIIDFRKPEENWYKKYGDDPKKNGTHDRDTFNSAGKPMYEWMKGHLRFTEREAKEEIISNGFVYERNIMEDTWKHHFVHLYRKPSFFDIIHILYYTKTFFILKTLKLIQKR